MDDGLLIYLEAAETDNEFDEEVNPQITQITQMANKWISMPERNLE